MKKFTKLALTVSLLSVAMAGFASAATTVRITGSSAFRAAVTNAVLHLLNSASGIQAVYTSYGSGTAPSSLGGANQQIIHGFLTSGGTEVYIKTSWSGSLSGLIAVSTNANTAQPFLSTSNINTGDSSQTAAPGTGADSSHGPTGGKALVGTDGGTAYDAAQVADVAMSDAFAASTPYSTNLVAAATGLTTAQRGGAPAGCLGVIPFTFVAGTSMPSTVTNLNIIQARALLQDALVLSQLTDVGTDSDTNVHCVGRDADSGTRFTTFTETGFSAIGVSNPDPLQYIVNFGSGTTASSIEPYPGETLFGHAYADGTQGYASGSGVAAALKATGTLAAADNPGQLIGYVGESDAVSAISGGAHVLSYNGVAYGTQTGNSVTFNRGLIDEGVYTLWGYEHMYYLNGSPATTIANAIAHQVGLTDAAVTGEILANMHVSRPKEGALITHN